VAFQPVDPRVHRQQHAHDGMPVLDLPVSTNPAGDQAQHMARQMWHPDPRRDEKTRVVGQAVQVARPRGPIPAEKGVAGRAVPRRGAEQRARHRSALAVADQISEILAHRVAVAQVVIVGQQAVEQRQVRRARVDDTDDHGLQVAQRSADRLRRRGDQRHATIATAVGGRALARGQAKMAGAFQRQQQRARRHVLGTPLGVAPAPPTAQLFADARAAPRGMLGEQRPDQLDVRVARVAPLQDPDACHGPYSTTHTRSESGGNSRAADCARRRRRVRYPSADWHPAMPT